MAGAKEVEKKEPSIVGDDGNTGWGLEFQTKESGFYLVCDGKPLVFSVSV